MLKLIRFLKGYRIQALLGPLFKIMEALFELIIPLIVAKIIDTGIAAGDTAYIYKMGGLMLLLGALGLGFSCTCQYLAAKASHGFGENVRGALYRHINKLSYQEIDKFGAPSLVTRLTNDVNQTQTGVAMFIRLVLRAPFILIGAIIMAMTIDLKLSSIFILMAIIVGIVIYFIMKRSSPYYSKIQKKLDNITLLAKENLTGARVVRAFSKQDEEQADFLKASESLSKTSQRVGKISALLNPLTYVIINTAIILVIYLGGIEVNSGNLSQGQIMALVNYLSQILMAIMALSSLILIFTKSMACAKRINEVLETKPSLSDEGNTEIIKNFDCPQISFRAVSFSYGADFSHSLESISIDIEKGQTLGIIGSTGSGKTTFINLLNRFYDVSEGQIKLYGEDIKNYPFSSLRNIFGLVPQKASLFYGTIRENICWGKKDAKEEEIWRALKIAQADEFVMGKPDGLDTMIMEGGKNLSGGQKQRLTIARALVGNPEILILDDSSSALDYATDSRLSKAIKENTSLMTVITISQRATSILNADKILVLDDGKAVGIGTHKELLSSCAVYKEIYTSQINTEEVKNG